MLMHASSNPPPPLRKKSRSTPGVDSWAPIGMKGGSGSYKGGTTIVHLQVTMLVTMLVKKFASTS